MPSQTASPEDVAAPRNVDARPEWSTWREIPAVVLYPAHIRRTMMIAFGVGTLLFAINQLDVVLAGGITPRVTLKIALTYLVPFCVSNYGLLVGRRVAKPSRPSS